MAVKQSASLCLNISGGRNSLHLKASVSIHSVNIFATYHLPSAVYGLTSQQAHNNEEMNM